MEQKEKDKLAKIAFNIMMDENNVVELSELGKKEMDRPAFTENTKGNFDSFQLEPDLTLKKQKWIITAVHCDGNINIVCEETHYTMDNCPIEWFKIGA